MTEPHARPDRGFHVTAPAMRDWRTRALFAALEAAFEEDGLPLAIVEVDEARGIHEVSLYADDEPRRVERRMRRIVGASIGPDAGDRARRRCPTSTGWRARWKG